MWEPPFERMAVRVNPHTHRSAPCACVLVCSEYMNLLRRFFFYRADGLIHGTPPSERMAVRVLHQ